MRKTEEKIPEVGSNKEGLISSLQKVQERNGYLPAEEIKKIAEEYRVTENWIYGVATFYTQFKLTKPPKHIINVCMGTACHVKGGARILDEIERTLGIKQGEKTQDLEYGLERVACVGCCALAPVVVIDKKVHGKMTPSIAKDLIRIKK